MSDPYFKVAVVCFTVAVVAMAAMLGGAGIEVSGYVDAGEHIIAVSFFIFLGTFVSTFVCWACAMLKGD